MNLGKFYNIESIIHEIDARLKFLFLISFSIEIFFINKIWVYIIIMCLILFLIKLSRVPIKLFFYNAKNILPLMILTSVINIFFIKRGEIIFKFFFVEITDYAWNLISLMIFRLIALLFLSLLVMFTTSANKLSQALICILLPFKKFLPVNDIAMILNIALRFMPILGEEFNLVLKAQKSRGIDLTEKKIISRLKNYLAILIPVFILTFRRADDLALAMESRCYNPDDINKKIYFHAQKFKKLDFYALYFLIIIHAVVIFFLR